MENLHFCRYSVCPMRSDKSDSSEMVSQLFFGEIAEVIQAENQWRQITTLKDQYTGWVDEKFLLPIREKDTQRWLDTCSASYDSETELIGPDGAIRLTKGAFLPHDLNTSSFRIGSAVYTVENSPRTNAPYDIHKICLSYLNAPYLWGGKTLHGIDCSGFTQMAYRFLDKNLPRDAYQQADEGILVEYGDHSLGDLAFFANSSGKITHVGIILPNEQIIHAHGAVRLDDLRKEGIFSHEKETITHRLESIRRV